MKKLKKSWGRKVFKKKVFTILQFLERLIYLFLTASLFFLFIAPICSCFSFIFCFLHLSRCLCVFGERSSSFLLCINKPRLSKANSS
uniref:Candidate secreted effector n=1 Tax=Meloidogyne incognita TaxID=6306 RepID=A0A914MHB1_MELIC